MVQIFEPHHIVGIDINSLSATAYDGFLVRIASADASITYTTYHLSHSGKLAASASSSFDRKRKLTKQSARAPILSELLKDAVGDTLSAFVESPEINFPPDVNIFSYKPLLPSPLLHRRESLADCS